MTEKRRITLTHEMVLRVISYDPDSGVFLWKEKISDKVVVGAVAGSIIEGGYRLITIFGNRIRAHRLAWFYMTGRWPTAEIDHKDLDPGNNRFNNLREATPSQNRYNLPKTTRNTSGYKGVSQNRLGSWTAQIRAENRTYFIGNFPTPEAAHSAYMQEARRLHGDFARAG